MDQGNGLLDRFIIAIPQSTRPLPSQQIAALAVKKQYGIEYSDIYQQLLMLLDDNQPTAFYLSDEALK